MKREVVSIYVDNKANVLSRVVSLYGRRGFNIDSLTVSATNNPDVSRITIVFTGDTITVQQIVSQTEKLEVVRGIKLLDKKESFFRELLMIKINAGKEQRSEIKEIVDIYRGKIVDLSKDSLIVELTGTPEKINGFMEVMADYDIAEVCRTGVTAIESNAVEMNLGSE